MSTFRAKVTTVPYGIYSLEGLMLENGEFAISVTQVSKCFQFTKVNASRDIKAMLGEGFQFIKTTSELNPKSVNILKLGAFEKLMFELVLRGNKQAIEMTRSLIGLSLQQLFSDAFGLKFDSEDRQAWLTTRMKSKTTRRTLTDSIKDYVARHNNLSDSYYNFIFANCSDYLNLIILGSKAKKIKAELDLGPTGLLRDVIPLASLQEIETVENAASRLIDAEDLEPLKAVRKAVTIMYAKTLGYQ